MRSGIQLVTGLAVAAALALLVQQQVTGQTAQSGPPPGTGLHIAKGMPPRANAGEYMARGQAGPVSIGAEFDRHSVPTADSILSTEDFITVEVGLFGASGTHLTISSADFSLRLNGKKTGLPVEQFAAVFKNLRDPNWTPPGQEPEKKPAGSIGGDGENKPEDDPSLKPIIHIPPEMERAMADSVQSSALPEGDRVLPVAGLIFFHYVGTEKSIHSVELVYSGPAGKATVTLQP